MGPRGGCCLWGVAVRSYYSPKACELEARELALRPDGEILYGERSIASGAGQRLRLPGALLKKHARGRASHGRCSRGG